jgi:sulfate permease, SulP family
MTDQAAGSGAARAGRWAPRPVGLAAGVVVGTVVVVVAVSFGVLIYGGATPQQVGGGITLVLAGSAVVAALTALRSSYAGTVAGAQDNTSVVLALLAAAIVAAAPATMAERTVEVTVVAAVAVATGSTGVAFLLLGRLRLGRLVRFVPYPVVGGFLAGTGWLLVVGGLEVLVGARVGLASLAGLLEPAVLLRWAPAVAGAGALLLWLRRSSRAAVLPIGLAAGVAAVHLGLLASGTSLAQARDAGWLLGPFPAAVWPPVAMAELAEIQWRLIAGQAGTIASLVLIASLSLLLNASGVEVAVARDVDLDRELDAAGVANLVAAAGGGAVGYPYASVTMLAHRAGLTGRDTGLLVAGVCIVTLALGVRVLSVVPVPVVGGLLVLLGLAFLADWLVDGRRSLPRADHAIVLAITVAIATLGLLPGVGLGLGLAVVVFVVRSSRVAVVKHVLTGASYRSNVERRPVERAVLEASGHRILVLELQGFVFFGTASGVVQEVARRRPAASTAWFVVIDLRRTTGIDSSAVVSLVRLARRVATDGGQLVLSGLHADRRDQLVRGGLALGDGAIPVLADLDRGVQWCEDRILATERAAGADLDDVPERADAAAVLGVSDVAGLAPFLERRTYRPGDVLVEQGRPVPGLFVVTRGQVTAVLEHGNGADARLRTLRAGTIVGEISFVLGTPATASVRADTDVEVAVLARDRLAELERVQPTLAARLHRRLARLASERLAAADRTIAALLE